VQLVLAHWSGGGGQGWQVCGAEAVTLTTHWHTCVASPTPRRVVLPPHCMALLLTTAAGRGQTAQKTKTKIKFMTVG